MTSIFSDILKNYGLTGNAAIDTLILSSIIPFVISYATMIFNFIQSIIYQIFLNKITKYYTNLKKKFLGDY